MTNIKEIALRVAEGIDDGSGEQYFVDQDGWITDFATALLAELSKDAELELDATEMQSDHLTLVDENHSLRQQLAASQAREKLQKDAIRLSTEYRLGNPAYERLSHESDDTALREYCADVVLKVKRALNLQPHKEYFGDQLGLYFSLFADKIRKGEAL